MFKKLADKFEKPVAEASRERPPLIEDELLKVIHGFLQHRSLPLWLPQIPRDVALWWIDMQEPPSMPADAPRRVSMPGDEGQRWICPYHERIRHTLRKFLSLHEHDQKIIMAAREDKVFWRGDDMPFFMRVIDETVKMRKMGVEAYRIEALKKMKSCRLLGGTKRE